MRMYPPARNVTQKGGLELILKDLLVSCCLLLLIPGIENYETRRIVQGRLVGLFRTEKQDELLMPLPNHLSSHIQSYQLKSVVLISKREREGRGVQT